MNAVRTVIADVVAINQPIVYNRFGSRDPWGMIYALRRDVVGDRPGEAMLRPGKRPRPLVLRVAEGDRLEIRFQNLLAPSGGGISRPEGVTLPDPPNDPKTRRAGIAAVGLPPLDGQDSVANGLVGIEPGARGVYRFRAERAGAYFFSSPAAIAGGEGDGGSLTHGLFGMIIVEPEGSQFYRSQVSPETLACARGKAEAACGRANPAPGFLDYEATDPQGVPSMNMLQRHAEGHYEIVHSDLTAIVVDRASKGLAEQREAPTDSVATSAWREFAIFFHDELKTLHADDFAVLNEPAAGDVAAAARHKQMVGTRDGFGINYGASGMGPILLANRLGKGPAKKCVDCAYEEFFLQSWANGDPALLAQYADDPSNVYHSYLGDRVKFYNVHAGPKETHVFHLHAHQWLSQPGNDKSNYLDSQTIAPFQTFNYEIHYGGTGNLNLTPGDSIFHCHLYPHFAQGMWALWRVHEVLEDGTRRLPDGGGMNGEFAGSGTDPVTGATQGGTPIPALVPLPGQALAPEPTYFAQAGENAMPGFPFYIPGKAGFRAPQPPLDMAEDAGLPRHLTLEGTRTLKPIGQALDQADMTFPIKSVNLQILPQEGTALERAAMRFHETAGRKIIRPLASDLGREGHFLVNGLPRAAGAPFANPCPAGSGNAGHWIKDAPSLATDTRRYDVSAIQLELVVNQYGWHDKQARINVLDRDVADFENKRRAADPFFFRARSGECIEFRHTNRAPGHTAKDAFQVATPVDVIGQHIHLVKFDVTASDGSGNGFNYEDGTLARDHIGHLIAASKAPNGGVDWSQSGESPRPLALKGTAANPVYQTTIQRWWADPLRDSTGKDRTIGTVFTHDHFGPSSIQQHGFYSALLVEPKGSIWKKPDGTPLERDGQAVGTQAIIETPPDPATSDNLIGSRREFALAVADFALLYDRNNRPVAPPQRPEAISVNHHDPYLINYKHEPMPLRVARRQDNGNWRQKTTAQGDMANVFDSRAHGQTAVNGTIDPRRNHARGDPSTEIFEAYDGDKVQVRLIQGAQEVQHVFTVHGQRWKRHPADPASPWVASQEIGISEHFEMDMQIEPAVLGNLRTLTTDYLYHAGSIDALWNGAWGLFRSYAAPETLDVARKQPIRCRLAALKPVTGPGSGSGQPGSKTPSGAADPACGNARPATTAAEAESLFPRIERIEGLGSTGNAYRPPEVTARLFCIEAIREPLVYNAEERITDPDGLRFVLRRQFVKPLRFNDQPPACPRGPSAELPPGSEELAVSPDNRRPLVLRMRSGEMAYVEVVNRFGPAPLPRTRDNAWLPPVVSWNDSGGRSIAADQLTPSSRVGLHPSLVSYAVRADDGARVGLNPSNAPMPSVTAPGGEPAQSAWYAGRVLTERNGGTLTFKWRPFEVESGTVAALSSMVDPIRHPVMGLVGALVIEPQNARIVSEQDGGTVAQICRGSDNGDCFREFVLVYQDGLNLKQDGQSIPDCHVCDDSYDSGDFAFNYRAEPLWARLGLPRAQDTPNPETGRGRLVDLSRHDLPACWPLPDFQSIATPIFRAQPGERVIVRAVHPGGRARQRAFITYGHRYDDMGLASFGSPTSSLLGPQRAISADLGAIREGLWLYRDGPAYMVAGGAWGYIDARGNPATAACPNL
ncbi:MAG: copper oxidase [Candidatus Competibacteraceae bacterium]|nr:copper oxidase [Candidatus Competibacteraceae bacterium]